MSQLQEENPSRIQNTEGFNNETESAIGFILQSSTITEVNNNGINLPTNNQFQIDRENQQLARLDRVIDFENFLQDSEQEGNAPPENIPQNNNNNIDSQIFTRFDFNRIFTNQYPEIKIRYKSIVAMLWRIVELQAVYLVFFLLLSLQCTVLRIPKIQLSVVIFVLHYGVEVYRNIRDFRRTFKLDDSYLDSIERCKDRNGNEIELNLLIKYRRMSLVCASIENTLLLTTCVMVIVYSTNLFKFYISICIVPLMLEFIIKVICSCIYIVSPLESGIYFTSLLYSAARIVILLPILLKVDGIVNCSWILALAGYWISFILLALVSLFCLALFCNSIHCLTYFNVSLHAVIGSYWYVWLTCGITISTFISMYYFVLIFDIDKYPRTPIRILASIFLPILLYQILLIIKTLICFRSLISFADFTFYSQQKTPIDPVPFQKLISFIPTSPIFLRKLSDVLFVRAGLAPVQADSSRRSRSSEEQRCHICFERKPDVVIMHCGHGGVCFICAVIFVQVDLRCYLCRHQIDCILKIEQQQINADCVRVSNVLILDCEQQDETIQRVITELNHCEEEKEEEKKSTQDLQKETQGDIIDEQANCDNFCENDQNKTSNPEICTNHNSSFHNLNQNKRGFCNIEVSHCTSFDKVEIFSNEESKHESHNEYESKSSMNPISTMNKDNLSQQKNMSYPIDSNFKNDGIQQKLLNSKLKVKNTYHSSKEIKKLSRAGSFGFQDGEQANRDHYYDNCEVSPRFRVNNITCELNIDNDSKNENLRFDNYYCEKRVKSSNQSDCSINESTRASLFIKKNENESERCFQIKPKSKGAIVDRSINEKIIKQEIDDFDEEKIDTSKENRNLQRLDC